MYYGVVYNKKHAMCISIEKNMSFDLRKKIGKTNLKKYIKNILTKKLILDDTSSKNNFDNIKQQKYLFIHKLIQKINGIN
mmetsp:Transcript_3303/g.4079  ORF Transcript_3303/g.4079 Transcript_3303/m.4079 type:complete len:80 (+) Transcript_3303:21-260(+)